MTDEEGDDGDGDVIYRGDQIVSSFFFGHDERLIELSIFYFSTIVYVSVCVITKSTYSRQLSVEVRSIFSRRKKLAPDV